jgi:hypothetical protein
MDEVKDMVGRWLITREEREFRESEDRAERDKQVRGDWEELGCTWDPYD